MANRASDRINTNNHSNSSDYNIMGRKILEELEGLRRKISENTKEMKELREKIEKRVVI